jgi:hypothetical protein
MTGVNDDRGYAPLMQHRTSAIAGLSLRSGTASAAPRVCIGMGQAFSRPAMASRSLCNRFPILQGLGLPCPAPTPARGRLCGKKMSPQALYAPR